MPAASKLADVHMMTIKQTLMTAVLIPGFWDRWIAHGLLESDLSLVRPKLTSLDGWIDEFSNLAEEKGARAYRTVKHNPSSARQCFRSAGLYLNLVYWIFPAVTWEKAVWYQRSIMYFTLADALSPYQISYVTRTVEGAVYYGRISQPQDPKGCVIIVCPIDSCKEELYSYEEDFNAMGYATVLFDGAGQGETVIKSGVKASVRNWDSFVSDQIRLARETFRSLPIHLFGTSSAGAWVLAKAADPGISSVVSVSPACGSAAPMPNYFIDRLSNMMHEGETQVLPNLSSLKLCKPTLMFHGGKDTMISKDELLKVYAHLEGPKKFVEYAEEGHCCNFKLAGLRQQSVDWFMEVV